MFHIFNKILTIPPSLPPPPSPALSPSKPLFPNAYNSVHTSNAFISHPSPRLLVPRAKAVLSQLNQFTTPLEKLYCFKQCISIVMTTSRVDGTSEAVTADELLPILVYLVIVCDIPNWNGNLQYINKFHFSAVGMEEFA